jgi:thiamine kinase-like enzyme
MRDKQQRWPEVQAYLTARVAPCEWAYTQPRGSGHETYFAHGAGQRYFVKLGAAVVRYELLASDGLTPTVLSAGALDDGTAIMVQPFVAGRKPARRDFQANLDRVARVVRAVHHHPGLRRVLTPAPADSYRDAAERALSDLRRRWERYRQDVPAEAVFVEEDLERIARDIARVDGAGLVASHNDICNDNWIVAEDGRLLLIDLEAMAPDDPARDLGALLWWYYPPEARPRFLSAAGYADDLSIRLRMRVRMAMHCLHIILPREDGFRAFQPSSFGAALTDFRAVLAGEENPQGYA